VPLRLATFVGCLVLAGCASYAPAPIEPLAILRAFEQRNLESPALQSYVVSHLNAKPGLKAVTVWDLESLTLAAYYFSPELDLARAKTAMTGAAVETAAQRPNPSLQLPFGYTSNAKPGESPYSFGFGLDIPIETAGKRGYRVAQAQQLDAVAQLEFAHSAWQVRSRLRTHLLDWYIAQQRGRILARQLSTRQQLVNMLDKRLSVGAASAPEVQRAHSALTQLHIEIGKASRQAVDAQAAAAAVIGIAPRALAAISVRFDAFKQADSEPMGGADREHALLNRSDVLIAMAAYEASQAALQLEVANQYPDIHLGPGYSLDAGAHKFAVAVSGISLPIFNSNQGPIAEAQARRKEAAARFIDVQAKAIGDTDRAAQHYRSTLAALHQTESLQAAQQQQSQATQRAFEIGEVDRLSVALAALELQTIALQQLDAQADLQRAIGEMDDAMQRPIMTDSSRHD
jgi:outer membrane protein, heavy metal efflux system